MAHPRGKKLPLSLPRRFISDLVHFAKQIPAVPMQRRMQLQALVDARAAVVPRPSWCAIFLKAYAQVCARRPELRRGYLLWPNHHLYEHPINVASIGIERRLHGEEAVFFAQLRSPESRRLIDIDTFLHRCKEGPLDDIAGYRRILRLGRLPRPIRRVVWWMAVHGSGYMRARYLGTFGISVVAGLGAAGLFLLSPLTTALNYGVFDPDGSLEVRLTYDHRVLDGATVARALADLEATLNGPILEELQALGSGAERPGRLLMVQSAP